MSFSATVRSPTLWREIRSLARSPWHKDGLVFGESVVKFLGAGLLSFSFLVPAVARRICVVHHVRSAPSFCGNPVQDADGALAFAESARNWCGDGGTNPLVGCSRFAVAHQRLFLVKSKSSSATGRMLTVIITLGEGCRSKYNIDLQMNKQARSSSLG